MNIKGSLQDIPRWQKVLLLIFLFIMSFIVSFLLTKGVVLFIEDKGWQMRIGQFFSSALLFIGVPVAYNMLTSTKTIAEKTNIKYKPNSKAILFTVLSMLFAASITGFLGKINQEMPIPEYLAESFRLMEDEAQRATMLIIVTGNPLTILFNFILIALIPAIGEELMFRVFLQSKMQEKMSVWSAIILTSILFSAMHLQFYGFLPRFALSIWLGVLYFWGRSTWLNSIAHFTNNVIGISAYYIYKVATGEWPSVSEMEKMESNNDLGIVSEIILLGFFALCIYMVFKHTRIPQQQNEQLSQETTTPTENNICEKEIIEETDSTLKDVYSPASNTSDTSNTSKE